MELANTGYWDDIVANDAIHTRSSVLGTSRVPNASKLVAPANASMSYEIVRCE